MTTIKLPHYLYQRGSIWWFRKSIPLIASRKEIRLSLKTHQLSPARSLALMLNNHYNRLSLPYSGTHKMTENQLHFFQYQLKRLIDIWWQREMEDFHGDFNKGINELNDLLHVASDQIEEHHIRIVGRAYQDDTRNRYIASKLLSELTDKMPDEESELTVTNYQQLALMVDQASLHHYRRLNQYFAELTPDWLKPSHSLAENQSNLEQFSERYLLSELIEKYKAENIEKEHSKKTQNKYNQCLALCYSFFGDVEIDTITLKQGRYFRDTLKKMPKGIKTKDMWEAPLLDLIKNTTEGEIIAAETANSHLNKVGAFFEWMVSLGYLRNNPIPNEPLPTFRVNHKDDRLAITDSEAKEVFSHCIFTEHKGIKTRKIQNRYHYWLPLICLFTGIRIGEACQLYTDDIEHINGIWCIRIDTRYGLQRLKTPNAKRYVPIHNQLIELGFLTFINDLKQTSENCRLFPEIKLIQGAFSTKPSEWFTQNLRDKQQLPKHVTLYAFRHTFQDKMEALHIDSSYLEKLMGRENGVYGSSLQQDQSAMYAAINRVNFLNIISMVKPYTDLTCFHNK